MVSIGKKTRKYSGKEKELDEYILNMMFPKDTYKYVDAEMDRAMRKFYIRFHGSRRAKQVATAFHFFRLMSIGRRGPG